MRRARPGMGLATPSCNRGADLRRQRSESAACEVSRSQRDWKGPRKPLAPPGRSTSPFGRRAKREKGVPAPGQLGGGALATTLSSRGCEAERERSPESAINPQKSLAIPFRSQSTVAVGSGPFGPFASFGHAAAFFSASERRAAASERGTFGGRREGLGHAAKRSGNHSPSSRYRVRRYALLHPLAAAGKSSHIRRNLGI